MLEGFKKIDDNSIDLIITSPPYNLGIKYDSYDDNKEKSDYEQFINEVADNLYRIIKPDGRVCINIPCDGNMKVNGENQKCDISFMIKKIFCDKGFIYRDKFYWDKEHLKNRQAWGSFESASSPNILLPFEEIIVFYKEKRIKEKSQNNVNEMINGDFIEYTNGHWKIKPYTIKEGCPVPFPQEIPKRLIQLYSFRGDIVLDPFSGNGTTCIVAKKLGRNFIGIELSKKYYDFSIYKMNKL